jgi:hypothetical protein
LGRGKGKGEGGKGGLFVVAEVGVGIGVNFVRCADAEEINNNQTITVNDSKPFIPPKLTRSLITFTTKNNYQLSIINYQLPTINYQLSIINYQLSIINYQLSIINYSLILLATVESHQIDAELSPVHTLNPPHTSASAPAALPISPVVPYRQKVLGYPSIL